MKKIVIKCSYFAAIFIIAYFIISAVVNHGNTDMTTDMNPVSFPVVNMNVNGQKINELCGYKDAMNCSFQRDSITPLEQGRKADITIMPYDNQIEKISFEVRSIDGERLIENTEIVDYTMQGEDIRAKFVIKDLIEENTEYILVIILEDKQGQVYRYYTRIIQTDDYYQNEKIGFAIDFHNKTFDKEAAKDLVKYLESNSEGDNTTYAKTTIHSNFNQVTWGDLSVKKMTEPKITVKELASQTGTVELDYIVGIDEGKQTNLYRVNEFYRMRYTSDRMYLLDYERSMKQIFDETASVYGNNKISLGIVLTSDIVLEESDGGNILAFTDGNRLYSYNITDNKLSKLFSFYDGNYADARENWQKHKIKILGVDEAGNVQFIVYGYMNRGNHEGEVGIALYNFSGLLNTVEEMAYITSDTSYEVLEKEIEELSYLNKSNTFFFMHSGSIYAVNMEDRNFEIMVSGLREGSYKTSKTSRMIVWQTSDNPYECSQMILMNLNTKEKTEINAGYGEYIAPLGFMGEDLIYGLTKKDDVVKDNTGSTLFPMYSVKIENEGGEVLKNYEQPGIYITGSEISGNQINLLRVEKNEETGEYAETTNGQIFNTQIETQGNNVIEAVATDKYENIVQIAVKNSIDAKNLKNLTPKEVLFEGERKIALKEEENSIPLYYVYGKGGINRILSDESMAVNLANDISGTVINKNGSYIWRKGNRILKNQIMAIKGAGITEEKNSLAVCLDSMLGFEGVLRNTEYMLNQGDTVINILADNLENEQVLDLTGCSLDTILYYPSIEIPVLSILNDGNAVLIIGYNEMNTVLMDPLTGTVYKKGMNDSKEMFEQNGNRFITYIKEE